MLNSELFCNPGTLSTVLDGSCTLWMSFACLDVLAVWLNGVWNPFGNGLLVWVKGLFNCLECDVAPELAIIDGSCHFTHLFWFSAFLVCFSFFYMLFLVGNSSGKQGLILCLSVLILLYFNLYIVVMLCTITFWPLFPTFFTWPILFGFVIFIDFQCKAIVAAMVS